MRAVVVAVLFALSSVVASAAEPVRLSLAETVKRDVQNDLVVARLEGRAEAPTAAAAQNDLNEQMSRALDVASGHDALTVRTDGYNVRPARYEDEPAAWIATQGLVLETSDDDVLLATVGELQEIGLAVQQLGGRLSDELVATVRDELTIEALEALGARAELAAGALGHIVDGWVEIRLDGADAPRPILADVASPAMESARAAPPVMTETTSTVRVTVQGTARLVP